MFKLLLVLSVFLNSGYCFGKEESKLGLDYLQLTENALLAEIMLEIEPNLMVHYQESKFGCVVGYVEDGVRGIASKFHKDKVNRNLMEILKKASPDIPLKFLKLDKLKYPNLWNYGDLKRLRKEKEETLWLYKALHGKDFEESTVK